MPPTDIVVVGGSAAGLTAAMTARRHYPNKQILVVRQEAQVPIPCGIPYIFGTLGDVEKNLISDGVYAKENLELRIAKATGIDRNQAVLHTDMGEVAYERLILATGSLPSTPPIPGADQSGVYPVHKDVPYLRDLQEKIRQARSLLVIGGGFIGVEFADEINTIGGKTITVVEVREHCLSLAYDDEFCREAEDVLRSRGVQVRTEARVERIERRAAGLTVKLADGSCLEAEVVLLGIGAVPNVTLAREAGLRIGATGSVEVDRTMRTSDERIFACGDCAEKVSFFGSRPSALKLASIATSEARIAGANLYGITRESPGTVGVWSTAIGEFALGTAGLTERDARECGYEVVTASVEGPNRHPGAMPSGASTKMKLVFEANAGTLLGGQVRSNSATGEMINAVAACVQQRMTMEDIAMFQMGTHPALTASPIAYPLVNAAELAIAARKRLA